MTGRVGRQAGEWAMRRWIVMLARSAARAACRSLALPLEPLRGCVCGCADVRRRCRSCCVSVDACCSDGICGVCGGLGRRRGACGGSFHRRPLHDRSPAGAVRGVRAGLGAGRNTGICAWRHGGRRRGAPRRPAVIAAATHGPVKPERREGAEGRRKREGANPGPGNRPDAGTRERRVGGGWRGSEPRPGQPARRGDAGEEGRKEGVEGVGGRRSFAAPVLLVVQKPRSTPGAASSGSLPAASA